MMAKGKTFTGKQVLIIISAPSGDPRRSTLPWPFRRLDLSRARGKEFLCRLQTFDARRRSSALGWAGRPRRATRAAFCDHVTRKPAARGVALTVLAGAAHQRVRRCAPRVRARGLFSPPLALRPGNWNLRMTARAEDGTLFEQRIAACRRLSDVAAELPAIRRPARPACGPCVRPTAHRRCPIAPADHDRCAGAPLRRLHLHGRARA
jgi:hypothetical protein